VKFTERELSSCSELREVFSVKKLGKERGFYLFPVMTGVERVIDKRTGIMKKDNGSVKTGRGFSAYHLSSCEKPETNRTCATLVSGTRCDPKSERIIRKGRRGEKKPQTTRW